MAARYFWWGAGYRGISIPWCWKYILVVRASISVVVSITFRFLRESEGVPEPVRGMTGWGGLCMERHSWDTTMPRNKSPPRIETASIRLAVRTNCHSLLVLLLGAQLRRTWCNATGISTKIRVYMIQTSSERLNMKYSWRTRRADHNMGKLTQTIETIKATQRNFPVPVPMGAVKQAWSRFAGRLAQEWKTSSPLKQHGHDKYSIIYIYIGQRKNLFPIIQRKEQPC